jgi:hypothetical protein
MDQVVEDLRVVVLVPVMDDDAGQLGQDEHFERVQAAIAEQIPGVDAGTDVRLCGRRSGPRTPRTGTPLGSDACRATQTGRYYDNDVPLQGGWSLLLESRRYPGQFNRMEQRGHRYPGRSQSEAGVRQRPV